MSDTAAQRSRAPSRAATRANFQRHALIPKPKALSYAQLVGVDVTKRATFDELSLLAWIADNADALVVEGDTFAVVWMPDDMLDRMAAVGARLADLEPDTDQEGIDEREHDTADDEDNGDTERDDAEQDAPTPALPGYRWGVEWARPAPVSGTDPERRPGAWLPVGGR